MADGAAGAPPAVCCVQCWEISLLASTQQNRVESPSLFLSGEIQAFQQQLGKLELLRLKESEAEKFNKKNEEPGPAGGGDKLEEKCRRWRPLASVLFCWFHMWFYLDQCCGQRPLLDDGRKIGFWSQK